MPGVRQGVCRYSSAQASSSAPPVIPASTNGDEPRAGRRVQRDLGCGGERVVVRLGGGGRLGADHADPAGPGGRDGAPGGGQDHLDDRHRVALAGVAEHRRAAGVAGDDQRLDALGDEMVQALQRELADAGDRLLAVRGAGGVAEIDDVLVRQLVDDRSGDRQPAEPGVEDPDRRLGVDGLTAGKRTFSRSGSQPVGERQDASARRSRASARLARRGRTPSATVATSSRCAGRFAPASIRAPCRVVCGKA